MMLTAIQIVNVLDGMAEACGPAGDAILNDLCEDNGVPLEAIRLIAEQQQEDVERWQRAKALVDSWIG